MQNVWEVCSAKVLSAVKRTYLGSLCIRVAGTVRGGGADWGHGALSHRNSVLVEWISMIIFTHSTASCKVFRMLYVTIARLLLYTRHNIAPHPSKPQLNQLLRDGLRRHHPVLRNQRRNQLRRRDIDLLFLPRNRLPLVPSSSAILASSICLVSENQRILPYTHPS